MILERTLEVAVPIPVANPLPNLVPFAVNAPSCEETTELASEIIPSTADETFAPETEIPAASDSPIRLPTPSKSAEISPIDPNASLIAVVILPDKSPRLPLSDSG